uniref:Uncharacterized protein n=1 Tax=Meloidogyne enterolobii TaxID=390850 RepID=A0A6V7XUV6_MELEN|nr:unnamed protein product [Meloidogyne enterolobii]
MKDRKKGLALKINRITLNILLDDAENQKYLFNGFYRNILNRRNKESLDEIHQMIIDKIKEMCSEYGDTSNWGYRHDYGSALGQNKRRNREYLKHSEYSGHQQQNYGYQTGYGNQHIYGYQQGFGIIQDTNNILDMDTNNTLDMETTTWGISKKIWESKEVLSIMVKKIWIQRRTGNLVTKHVGWKFRCELI